MARFRVLPEKSRLWAEARSSLHPIKVETQGLTGFIEAEIEDGTVKPGGPFQVEIDAERLRSGNGLVDGELQRRLETKRFPKVLGDVKRSEALALANRWRFHGELVFHGVARATEADVMVRLIGERLIEVDGEKVIDMRDYGLSPPKLLIFKVYPEVKVRARLVAERES